MILWRVYYDDGATFSNLDGSWTAAPIHGVICVVVRDPTETWGRWVNSGYAPHKRKTNEFYVKYPDNEEPFPTWDLAPFKDRMATVFPDVDADLYIKFGRQTDQENWGATMNRASADPDFPVGTPRRRSTDWPSA